MCPRLRCVDGCQWELDPSHVHERQLGAVPRLTNPGERTIKPLDVAVSWFNGSGHTCIIVHIRWESVGTIRPLTPPLILPTRPTQMLNTATAASMNKECFVEEVTVGPELIPILFNTYPYQYVYRFRPGL